MQSAAAIIYPAIARAIAPREPLTLSQWADNNRIISSKEGAIPGKWRTSLVEILREPMDCLSTTSPVQKVVLKFPVQSGKTAVAQNLLGYTMDHDPGPIMVALPGEVSMKKWIAQKLDPMIEETPAIKRALTSVASRDSSNQKAFKDFAGGQLYIEHAGNPARLKSSSVRILIVDEIDEFATALKSGDDPQEMLEERTSGFPDTKRELIISTPGIEGISRVDAEWKLSDQRLRFVPCPECGHMQPLEWSGLHWDPDATACWYGCNECGFCIEEHHKPAMLAAGEWRPQNPESAVRGYTFNCLYYAFGLGPRWLEMVHKWRAAQNDPAKLKTFVNSRLAETWEDPAMRAVKQNIIADRAEPYRLRHAPAGVLAVTAGVDTQDNRLAVHITGWGRGMAAWTLDYVELPGDPLNDDVWVALTALLNKGIEHEYGGLIRVESVAIDAGGHRTEDVKAYVRSRLVRRPLCIFGAKPNNAPILSRGKLADVNHRGRLDKRGVQIYQVGTVAIKHWLYSRLGADADKQTDDRLIHISQDLPDDYAGGLVSEIYNPAKNRFEKRRGGPRNEPLDGWTYSFAAAHHPELRLHRLTKADWDARETRLRAAGREPAPGAVDSRGTLSPAPQSPGPQRSSPAPAGDDNADGFASSNWSKRL